MIDDALLDPTLLVPAQRSPSPTDMTPEKAFEKELSRWVVKELTAPMFAEGAPLEGAGHLQALFQDALSDRLAASLPGSGTDQRSATVGGSRSLGPVPSLHDHVHDSVRISSGFGVREHPILGGRRMHHGIDVAAPMGTDVQAARAGVVTFAGRRGSYGNLVIVDHGGGLETRYAHLSRIDVSPGTFVPAGRRLGGVGSTGRSTGPHLHFETRLQGTAVDPLDHLPDFATQVIGKLRR
jgi:murein DD-endopeptidase MepM/ murein hydrolase activator NlpD